MGNLTTKQSDFLVPLLAGLLPLVAVTFAYLVNIYAADAPWCNPFWSGCISISRAARSGPGLVLFKALALPGAVFMFASWIRVGRWATRNRLESARMTRLISWLGFAASVFMAVYVLNLGLDGTVYRFMRRFGVNSFFGFTVINQLLLVRMAWPSRARLQVPVRSYFYAFTLLVSLEWLIGVGVTAKRLVTSDPNLLTRLENVSEWWFALLLVTAFILISRILPGNNSAGEWKPAE